jgi:hypothetical protein
MKFHLLFCTFTWLCAALAAHAEQYRIANMYHVQLMVGDKPLAVHDVIDEQAPVQAHWGTDGYYELYGLTSRKTMVVTSACGGAQNENWWQRAWNYITNSKLCSTRSVNSGSLRHLADLMSQTFYLVPSSSSELQIATDLLTPFSGATLYGEYTVNGQKHRFEFRRYADGVTLSADDLVRPFSDGKIVYQITVSYVDSTETIAIPITDSMNVIVLGL